MPTVDGVTDQVIVNTSLNLSAGVFRDEYGGTTLDVPSRLSGWAGNNGSGGSGTLPYIPFSAALMRFNVMLAHLIFIFCVEEGFHDCSWKGTSLSSLTRRNSRNFVICVAAPSSLKIAALQQSCLKLT